MNPLQKFTSDQFIFNNDTQSFLFIMCFTKGLSAINFAYKFFIYRTTKHQSIQRIQLLEKFELVLVAKCFKN